MSEQPIVNRVAQSALVTLDLEEIYPKGPRTGVDISQWLEEGLLLREKNFRAALAAEDWSRYTDNYVHLYCSTEAIIPAWAYLLLATYLGAVAKKVVVGTSQLLETVVFQEAIAQIPAESFQGKPVIIKGCSKVPVPPTAYLMALEKIRDQARSIQYGEACSSVPLLKNRRG
ncbi:Protein of unknown function [Robiginitalea myxolifaciens]|uniref:DUF2480 family protein n=1 Tax=Robiginitalea myxolifaciens TaxID=400055 RepID=A0A1I6G064_9FLAO|nr:DUF2480 family protein [Robiginitalea myxolifaciens]SFR35562.1 Protein of unknown function [Robiginitalea myxolifaciens]